EVIEDDMLDGISFKGWQSFGNKTFTYTAKVDLGVNAKFMGSCSNITDKARLSVSDPKEKLCAAFIAGINSDKTDDIFSIYPKEGAEDSAFTGNLKELKDDSQLWQSGWSTTTKNIMKQQMETEAAAAIANSASVGNTGIKYKYAKGNFDVFAEGYVNYGIRTIIQNNADNSFLARQDIGVVYSIPLGANHKVKASVMVGGRALTAAKGLATAFRCLKNVVQMIAQAFERPHEKGPQMQAEAAVTKANATAVDNSASNAKTAVTTAATTVAAANPSDPASVTAAKAAVATATDATQDLNAKNQTLNNGSNGATSVTGNIEEIAGKPVVSETLSHLENASNALNQTPPNVGAASTELAAAK
ncbi:hypothetical protein EBR43_14270, partial [bacterium]|nr:hypothetical protein [bacterium]